MRIFTIILDVIRKLAQSIPLFNKSEHEANVLQPILNTHGSYIFYCPGCKINHLINTTPKKGTYHVLTGSLAKPTIRESVLVAGDENKGVPRCHAYITLGMIEYLKDSSHELSNRTIRLEPLE